MGKGLFITGTGTDIGKTYVTGLIVKKLRDAGYNGGYYKAALSGAEPDEHGILQPGDALHVNRLLVLARRYRTWYPMFIGRRSHHIWRHRSIMSQLILRRSGRISRGQKTSTSS